MKKERALGALAALAQEHRLDVFRCLVQAGKGGLSVGVIGRKLALPGPTLSFHLKVLKEAGLVTAQRNGTTLICRADYGRMNGLVAYLTENCCAGEPCETGLVTVAVANMQ